MIQISTLVSHLAVEVFVDQAHHLTKEEKRKKNGGKLVGLIRGRINDIAKRGKRSSFETSKKIMVQSKSKSHPKETLDNWRVRMNPLI